MVERQRYDLDMPLANGNVFAGHALLRSFGCVGMGEVCLVQHSWLPGREALTVLSAGVCAADAYCRHLTRQTVPAAALMRLNVVRAKTSMGVVDGTDAASRAQQRPAIAPTCAPPAPAVFPSRARVGGALPPQALTPAA